MMVDITFEVELVDWANNSNHYTYPLVLDRTLPEVDWGISPSNNGVLSDHRLGFLGLVLKTLNLNSSTMGN